MAKPGNKHSRNSAGPYYCTDSEDPSGEGCIACALCFSQAPNFFSSDEGGRAFVKLQPETAAEVEEVEAALAMCPVSSIGNDGGD